MSRFVKLCGLTTPSDILVAVQAGVDAVGLVMTPSPRMLSLREAARLRALVPAHVLAVAVFHEPSPDLLEEVARVVEPDLFQATPDALVGIAGPRALPVLVDGPDLADRAARTDGHRFLVDSAAKGGTGRAPDLERLASIADRRRMVLAGGLTPANVAGVLAKVDPGGVDVSSGVESSPGVKDHRLMAAFVEAVRESEPVEGEVTV